MADERDNFVQGEKKPGVTESDITQAYKATFLGDEAGKLVLQDILWELYFLRRADTPEQQALCNFAKSLLTKIYGQEIEYSGLERIFRKLFSFIRRVKI